MWRGRFCVAAALIAAELGACASPAPVSAPQKIDTASPVLGISSETLSWGVAVERWTISSNGVGSLTTTALGPNATPQTKPLKTSAETFRAVVEALEPLTEKLRAGITCDGPLPTDMQTVSITWSRKANSSELWLYGGCRSAEAAEAFALMYKAREIALSGAAE